MITKEIHIPKTDRMFLSRILSLINTDNDFRKNREWPACLNKLKSLELNYVIVEGNSFICTDEMPEDKKPSQVICVADEIAKLETIEEADLLPDQEVIREFTHLATF